MLSLEKIMELCDTIKSSTHACQLLLRADVIDAFNTASRYLDDILNINNVYFDNMVSQIYPSELQRL